MKEAYEEMKQRRINKEPTKEIKIDGIGTAKLFGEIDADNFIKKLMEFESITG